MAIPIIFDETKLERMNFKNELFLSEREFIREQDYHMFRRYLLNCVLHGYGIAGEDSFATVTRNAESNSFVVSPGIGIDRHGKEIILLSQKEVTPGNPDIWVGTIPSMQEPWYLIARHNEIIVDDPFGQLNWNGEQQGQTGIPEIQKDIIIFTSSVLPPGPEEIGIVLARWTGNEFETDIEQRINIDNITNISVLLEQHINSTINAHQASAISFTSNSFSSTNVEGALNELVSGLPSGHSHSSEQITHEPSADSQMQSDNVKDALDELGETAVRLNQEKASVTHSHTASDISFGSSGEIQSSTVQAAIVELDSEKAPIEHFHDASVIPFDNTGTEIESEFVQGAIVELDRRQSVQHDHDAIDIDFSNQGTDLSATEVQSAIVELYETKSSTDHGHTSDQVSYQPDPTSGNPENTVTGALHRLDRLIMQSGSLSPLRVGLMDDDLSESGDKGGQVIITDPCTVSSAESIRAFVRVAPHDGPLVVRVNKISAINFERHTVAIITFSKDQNYPQRPAGITLGNSAALEMEMDDVLFLSLDSGDPAARYLSVSVEAEPVVYEPII